MGPENRSIQRLVPARAAGTRTAPPAGSAPRPQASLAARGVGAILDAAFEVLRARFGTCMLLAVPISIPVQLLAQRVPAQLEGTDSLLLLAGHVVFSLAVQSVVVGLTCQVVYDELQGRELRLRRVLMRVLKRGPALLLLTALTAILTGVGVACCLVPGILAVWLLMVAPAALILEELGTLAAMGRSARLMSRSFGRWLGVVLVQTLLLLPLTLVSTALAEPSAAELIEQYLGWPPALYEGVVVLLTSSTLGLATAFTAVVMTIFYLDSRVRLEGFDLHMRLERLMERPRP